MVGAGVLAGGLLVLRLFRAWRPNQKGMAPRVWKPQAFAFPGSLSGDGLAMDLWLWLRSVKLEGVECVLAAGRYILLRPANASPALDNIDPDHDEIVAELEEGQAIELTEIVYLEEMQRVPRA